MIVRCRSERHTDRWFRGNRVVNESHVFELYCDHVRSNRSNSSVVVCRSNACRIRTTKEILSFDLIVVASVVDDINPIPRVGRVDMKVWKCLHNLSINKHLQRELVRLVFCTIVQNDRDSFRFVLESEVETKVGRRVCVGRDQVVAHSLIRSNRQQPTRSVPNHLVGSVRYRIELDGCPLQLVGRDRNRRGKL